jgi:ABC-2 type transport system ATP-binding protein
VLAEVEQTVDQIVVIGAGRLVAQGPLEELVAGDERPARVRSPRAAQLRRLLEADGGVVTTDGRPEILLVHHLSLEHIGTLAAEHGLPLFELTRETTTLEERFLELTGEGGHVR